MNAIKKEISQKIKEDTNTYNMKITAVEKQCKEVVEDELKIAVELLRKKL